MSTGRTILWAALATWSLAACSLVLPFASEPAPGDTRSDSPVLDATDLPARDRALADKQPSRDGLRVDTRRDAGKGGDAVGDVAPFKDSGKTSPWTIVQGPSSSAPTLRDVWAPTAAQTAFVVGDKSTFGRFVGTSWTSITVGGTVDLYGVHGTSTTDVVAVGGTSAPIAARAFRYTGGTAASPLMVSTPTDGSMRDVCIAGTNMVAVGVYGSSTFQYWTWDLSSGGSSGGQVGGWPDQGGAWCAPGVAISAGGSGKVYAATLTSSGWPAAEIHQVSGAPELHGVWAVDIKTIFVAGDSGLYRLSYAVAPPYVETHPVSTGQLRSVWGSSAQDLYAVGGMGVIMHYQGGIWTQEPLPAGISSPTTITFSAVHGNSLGEVYVVGTEGVVLRR